MENYRSQSTREGRIQQGQGDRGASAAPTSMHELRSYSTSYASSYVQPPPAQMDFNYKEGKMKKTKSKVASSSKTWSFNGPELQRKKRVVSYKAYAMEGKMKGSLRKSFRYQVSVSRGLQRTTEEIQRYP